MLPVFLHQNHAETVQPQPDLFNPNAKYVDAFSFDDLLVSCCQEIMVRGWESADIPASIKDWISGKILNTLPKRLIQKLLAYLVNNKDSEGLIGFRERENQDVPEFTLFLYRTEKARERLENKKMTEKMDDLNVFDGNECNLTGEGLKLFSGSLVIDHSQVPQRGVRDQNNQNDDVGIDKTEGLNSKGTKYGPITGRKDKDFTRFKAKNINKSANKSPKRTANDNDTSNDETDSNSNSEEATEDWKVKKIKNHQETMKKRIRLGVTRKMPPTNPGDGRSSCHLCPCHYKNRGDLWRHFRNKHPEYWNELDHDQVAVGKNGNRTSAVNTDKARCTICDIEFSTPGCYYTHLKNKHPKLWENRDKTKREITEEVNRKKLIEYEEIVLDEESNMWTCSDCGKQWAKSMPSRIIKHVETVHRGIREFECTLCGKFFTNQASLDKHGYTHSRAYDFKCELCDRGFGTKYALHEEHNKRHHPEIYAAYKLEQLENEYRRKQFQDSIGQV